MLTKVGLAVLVSLVLLPFTSARAEALLILMKGDSGPSIVELRGDKVRLDSGSQAIVVWSDGEREAWQYLSPGTTWTQPRRIARPSDVHALLHASRGQSSGSGSSGGGQMAAQLVQILGQSVTRGSSFLTPHNGYLLEPRITIRRRAASEDKSLPAATAVLTRGTTELGQIAFEAGQQKVTYSQTMLAKQHPEGLPSGEYSLRIMGSSESSTFTIDDPDWSAEVMQLPDRYAELTGDRENSLFLHVATEHVLDQLDENGAPLPYLSDALDLLESVPDEELSVYLRDLKSDVVKRLEGGKREASGSLDDPTGIPQIDQARRLIQSGDWRGALDELDSPELADDRRAKSLATLYRAVILGESGLGAESDAITTFRKALGGLAGSDPSDAYRAHTNYANFLLNQTQDRLYNHAFQTAAGVKQPLLTALTNWRQAREEYRAASKAAGRLEAEQLAAVQVNVARLYVLLADLIRTLDTSVDGNRQFAAGDKAAADRAIQFASQAGEHEHVEPIIRAASEEIQAHLAFRARDSQQCLEHANRAQAAYLDAGSLAGVEGIHRLLGLYNIRVQEFVPDQPEEESRNEALQHLLISRELAELLRERIPTDQFGTSQAGFFARRAYVNEQIIDLLVQQGEAAQALRIAEAAKARSLQDLLAVEKTGTQSDDEDEGEELRPLSDLLDQWPADVAALEYYLGSVKSWLFVVNTQGEVTAFDLLSSESPSQQLVADIHQFLNGVNHAKQKMFQRALAGRAFDHSWQDTLHGLRQTLVPDGVLEELNKADTVVVVPHHILHYFPFAALVTERDERKRDGPLQMIHPKFLIDESFDLAYAPSLGVWDLLRSRPDDLLGQVGAVGIVEVPGTPPLPGVDADMKNLNEAFGDKVTNVLFDKDATESNVQGLFSSPGLLLFSMHGQNDWDRPLEGHLVCLPDTSNDGRLTAGEVYGADIRSDLIVMSACYSGLADKSPLPGDDLFGIQRAFLQSGVRTVVSGLWMVDDGAGPILMKGFFEQMAQAESAPTALAKSQRSFLEDCRTPNSTNEIFLHPHFWAVYTVAGDDRTRFED